MDMEPLEEFSGSNDQMIVKGKRSKRPRPPSPISRGATSTSSSGGGDGDDLYSLVSSPMTGATVYSAVPTVADEDEDMANCLILLAQSGGNNTTCGRPQMEEDQIKVEKITSKKFTQMATSTNIGKVGIYVYECKTCNRSFPSFQALGGHRASHKRPKPNGDEKKSPISPLENHQNIEEFDVIISPKHDHHQLGTNKGASMSSSNTSISHHDQMPKIHECSICGAEFTSGQALGGHMRRHRSPQNVTKIGIVSDTSMSHDNNNEDNEELDQKPTTTTSRNNVLALDLNLPAPAEDDHGHRKPPPEFEFPGNHQKHLVFSAAALVDCHY